MRSWFWAFSLGVAILIPTRLVEGFSIGVRNKFPRHFSTYLKAAVPMTDTSPPDAVQKKQSGGWGAFFSKVRPEKATVCVIGGGCSGLTAALTAAEANEAKIVLLEASERVGGRVQSDVTSDGYLLDIGFAVFIEEYPFAKKLLDYDALKLGKFLPGAFVKLKDETELARVSDPLRVPTDLFVALIAPVGSIIDKIKVLPLIWHTRQNSVEELFEEPETDTLSSLKERWGFSDDMIDKFFKPFLEGIYLAPLNEQSSRMFTFVFKMFSEGSATLPLGGMTAVAKQLEQKVTKSGVDIRLGQAVSSIARNKNGGFTVIAANGKSIIEADSVIVATDGKVAQKLISQVEGLESLSSAPETKQRCVGCLYYAFDGAAPVSDPILILNGIGSDRGSASNPVNNVCFPSVVNEGYAPKGSQLCSVTVLSDAMESYKGKEDELDMAVRRQLGTWFPEYSNDIKNKWELKKIYYIPNAQPSQLRAPFPANANGGRDPSDFRGNKLPDGLFVCGDHMATATLNGALESGVKAGQASAEMMAAKSS